MLPDQMREEISLNTLNASAMALIARKRDLAAVEMKQIPTICDAEERKKIEKLTDLHVRLYKARADGEMTQEAFRKAEYCLAGSGRTEGHSEGKGASADTV